MAKTQYLSKWQKCYSDLRQVMKLFNYVKFMIPFPLHTYLSFYDTVCIVYNLQKDLISNIFLDIYRYILYGCMYILMYTVALSFLYLYLFSFVVLVFACYVESDEKQSCVSWTCHLLNPLPLHIQLRQR